MTDKPIRRDFLKTAAASVAVLTIRPFRDGNAFFDVKSSDNPTPSSDTLTEAIRLWRPNPVLKITGLEISVSEHARFVYNELSLRIVAQTKLQPPTTDENWGFCALVLLSRQLLDDPKGLTYALHRSLNAECAFNWVKEGHPIPNA